MHLCSGQSWFILGFYSIYCPAVNYRVNQIGVWSIFRPTRIDFTNTSSTGNMDLTPLP
jgi:hypothetical protein